MRVTRVLWAQHLDRMFKKHWRIQGKRVPIETGAEAELKSKGIPVLHPLDVTSEKKERFDIQVIGPVAKPILLDTSHPKWHNEICYMYRDNNVVLEGINQCKILTKTVEIQSGLPKLLQETIDKTVISPQVDSLVQKSILSANVFDTQQEKLPKIKDPNRPAFNFPRVLGITDARKSKLISNKLLHLCEIMSDTNTSSERGVVTDAYFSVPIIKDGDLIQYEIHAETLITARRSLKFITDDTNLIENTPLPDLFPVKHTITIPEVNIYELRDVYPITADSPKSVPHTVILHFSPLSVTNLYETEVTESQIIGRALLKAFTVAAASARRQFGNDVIALPKPITIQCVQTDGRMFDFSVFQLNTLDLNGTDGLKNVLYRSERMSLFSECAYKDGRPLLAGYNQDVFKHLVSFYVNQ